MYQYILKNKILLILVVVIMLSVISQDAYARGGWGSHNILDHGHRGLAADHAAL